MRADSTARPLRVQCAGVPLMPGAQLWGKQISIEMKLCGALVRF